MGVSSSESHDLTAFYELETASFGVLSQNTGFYPSLDRIVETTLGPLNLGPGAGSYNEPISCLHRHDLVHVHHSTIVIGHPGHWKMLELVSQNYWWPGLSRYVAKFIAGCDACNWTKTFLTQKVGKLIPNKVPARCWQVISVDMIRELPDSKGYNATLMVVDHLSKQIHAIPTVTSLDSAGVAWLFLEHVWCHHRLPEEVISDSGPAFVSNFSHNLATLLGVKLTPSTSYHPQTDSQTEHVNQEIEAYL